MTTFQVGQRVICVDAADSKNLLHENDIYTVGATGHFDGGAQFLTVASAEGVHWGADRFEPWPDPPEDMLEVIEGAACEHLHIESRCLKCGESKGEDVFELVRQRDELRKRADDYLAMLRSTEERLRHVAGQRDNLKIQNEVLRLAVEVGIEALKDAIGKYSDLEGLNAIIRDLNHSLRKPKR